MVARVGKHNEHLPRKDLNKGVGKTLYPSDSKTLERLARAQGEKTKSDAKAAKDRK